LRRFGTAFGAKFELSGVYEAWDYVENSPLARDFLRIYGELFGDLGITPRTEAIHAGLECGTIISRLGGCDAIAIGPNVYDIHSPDERLDLKSFERFWKLVIALIKA
jgi:dipeptidase D